MRESDANFLVLSEPLRSNGGIIRVPEGATCSLDDVIAVISYAATSTANSPEAAVRELKRKMGMLQYLPQTQSSAISTKIMPRTYCHSSESPIQIALTGMPNEPVDVIIDFYEIGYYGDKNDPGVKGIKLKNGTS